MAQNVFTKIFSFFKDMQKAKRTRLIILISMIIVIILSVSLILNQKSYSVLYSQMDPADAGEVFSVLSEMNMDVKSQGDDTILVADDQIDAVRMQLAAQGYPKSGVNYEIFQNAAGIGVTDMEKQVYYQFQLQENLRQTIMKLDKIKDAVVNINLAKESSFVLSDDEKPATAAVTLMLQDNAALSNEEVRAIAELVSKSVSGLNVEDVRIIDSQMRLYSINDQDETGNTNSQMDLQQNVQSRLQEQVINLLTPIFGEKNIFAEVHVTLNFDQIMTESVEFSPPANGSEGIVVSMKELKELIKDDPSGAAAGVDSNGGATQYFTSDDIDEDAVYYQTSREANYEINQTKTIIENAKGKIEDLSVAILFNSADMPQDYTDSVISLVANAIGVSKERITVETLPFKEIEQAAQTEDTFALQRQIVSDTEKASTFRLVITLAAALIIMILIVSVFRMFRPKKVFVTEGGEMGKNIDLAADEDLIPNRMGNQPEVNEKKIDFNKKDSKVSVLEEYIDKNPESIASLLRNWLSG